MDQETQELLEQRTELLSDLKSCVFIAGDDYQERSEILSNQISSIDELIKSLIKTKI